MAVDAGAPYDSSSLSDIILCSSDQISFYVLGAFLRYVSPVFRTMFLLDQGQSSEHCEKTGKHPIIPLAEDGETLQLLLDSIYPRAQEPRLDDIRLFWKVSRATQKYCMDVIEDKLRKRILRTTLIKNYPLRIYAIATDLGWEDVALAAAQRTLQTPLEHLAYVDELQSISGAGFYQFLDYRLRGKTGALLVLPGAARPRAPADADLSSGPFTSSTAADLVLRSSDSVDFFVLEALIRRVSPIFDGMFPLPGNEVSEGRPVIQVAESCEILRQLLGLIFHDLGEPEIKEYQLYIQVVLAARKYGMAVIEEKYYKHASLSPLISIDPLQMYAVASALGWKQLAKTAALATLSQPLENMAFFPELHLITGADLYRLVRFRFECANAACMALTSNPILANYGFPNWGSYCTRDQNSPRTSKTPKGSWLECSDPCPPELPKMTFEMACKKLKARPRGSTITNIYATSIELAMENTKTDESGKFTINPYALFSTLQSVQTAANVVEEAVEKVLLEIQ